MAARSSWASIDLVRQRNVRRIRSEVFSALESMSDVPDVLSVDTISTEPARQMLIDIYAKTGRPFAMHTYGSFKKNLFDEDQWKELITSYIDVFGVDKITSITNTTKKYLKAYIAEAITNNYTIEEIQAEVKKKMRVINRTRALMIARTEVVGASNLGMMKGAEMTGLPLWKKWVSTVDNRTRRATYDHLGMNGVEVSQNDLFRNPELNGDEMAYPGDMTASAGNVINCRCALAFTVK